MRELNIREKELLYRIENKPSLRPFFFRKAKGLHWFDPLNKKGFFSPEENPKPVPAREEGYITVPTWPAAEYLAATAHELSSPDLEDYAVKFLSVIRAVTTHAQRNGFGNHRTWWQFSKILNYIPTKIITDNDLVLINYWLDDPYDHGLAARELGEKWLPKLLGGDEHSTSLGLNLIEKMFFVRVIEENLPSYNRKKAVFRLRSSDAKSIADKIASISGKVGGLEAVEIFKSKLVSVLEELKNDSWSSIWRGAIEEHDQNHGADDAEHILLAALRDCLLGAIEYDLKLSTEYLRQLLVNQYQTLKRVAIYVIDQRFYKLHTLIEQVILAEHFSNDLRHEMWNLLSHNFSEFQSGQKSRVLEIIESLNVANEEGNIEEKRTAYIRLIWLSAIKDTDIQGGVLYRKYSEITNANPKNPDFPNYMSVGWVTDEDSIPIDELLVLPIAQLVEKFNSYEDTGSFGKPDFRGLAKVFKEVIKARANEFYTDLDKFSNLDYVFVYEIIEAYRELWSEKVSIQWKDIWPKLLEFCATIVNNDYFWSEEASKKRESFVGNRYWMVTSIAMLIEAGTKSDEHAFEPSLLPKAKEILLQLLAGQEGEEFKNESNAVSIAINSPRGHCIEALINHSLRSCRVAYKERGEYSSAWQEYESIYDDELRRSDQGEHEFSTLVSLYLLNFLYMSREWVQNNLSRIFDQSNYQKWLCAMQGYSHINTVHKDVYNFLKEHGDFIKALTDENLKDHVHEKVIQNIVVSYISGDESLDDRNSLICLLLERAQFEELRHLIWFIWTLRGKDQGILSSKVSELWPKMLAIIDVKTREGRKLSSLLCHWATFIDDINDINRNWLLRVVPYAEEDYTSPDLLKNLARISKSQPFEAQRIWLAMLTSYSYDYPEESIREILANLIAVGQEGERKAKEIVDAYIRHGVERPRVWLMEVKKQKPNA